MCQYHGNVEEGREIQVGGSGQLVKTLDLKEITSKTILE